MSLKDQLLNAGLVSDKKARQTAHQQRVARKQGRPDGSDAQAAAREEAAREAEAQRARDREAGERERQTRDARERELSERQRRESAARRAFAEGLLAGWEGPRDYYFTDGTTVRLLKVTEEASRRLEQGRAAIVRHPASSQGFAVLVAGAAKALRDADPSAIVTFHEATPGDQR